MRYSLSTTFVAPLLLLAAVGLVLASCTGGGGGCELKALQDTDITQLDFQRASETLGEVASLASAGAMDDAESAFDMPSDGFEGAHNFVHNVSPQLRAEDPSLAKQVCETVVQIEDALAAHDSFGLSGGASQLQDLIGDSALALGFAPPGR
jgi:hypothetical protein